MKFITSKSLDHCHVLDHVALSNVEGFRFLTVISF